jgi:BMFP domain-containing protein YqiC
VLRRPDEAIAYLARGMDLSELFKRKLNDEARRLLLNVHPMRLCERVTSSAPATEELVKVVLDRGIRERLMHDFNAEPISILIETLDSGFTRSFNNFWNETITFDAELFSQSPQQGGPAVYSFDCQIGEMTSPGWEIAAAAGFDFVKFKTQLVNALKGELENHDSADTGDVTNSETAVRIKNELVELVTAYASGEFGVGLRVRSVRRKMTEAEKKLREAAVANELARIELVRKLEHDLLQLIAIGGRAEEIVAGRRRIAELKAYNTTPPNNHTANGKNAGVTQVEDFEVAK